MQFKDWFLAGVGLTLHTAVSLWEPPSLYGSVLTSQLLSHRGLFSSEEDILTCFKGSLIHLFSLILMKHQ